MSSADQAMLVDMGFNATKAEKALQITGHKGVEPAMEWLLAHNDDSEPVPEPSTAESSISAQADTPTMEDSVAAGSSQISTTEEAKSMKCDICGKLFKSNLEVEFHATKSGHDRFSESTEEKKPLSEEDKKVQLKLLNEKLKQKRREREEQEKKEALEREKNRIKSGKEIAEARKKLQDLEMKKILEQRRREKQEEKDARQRIKAQIEEDKAARRAKSAAQAGIQPTQSTTTTPAQVTMPTSNAQLKKSYNETRLQIRLTNGVTLTQNFGSKEQLSAVRLFIEMNRSDGSEPFSLVINFPKKVFTEEDYEKPLDVLGLVPSAVIFVLRKV